MFQRQGFSLTGASLTLRTATVLPSMVNAPPSTRISVENPLRAWETALWMRACASSTPTTQTPSLSETPRRIDPPPGRFAKALSVGPRALAEYSENVFASRDRVSPLWSSICASASWRSSRVWIIGAFYPL